MRNPKCKHILCSFACDGCVWYTNRIPVNPSSGGSYCYEEVLPTRMYCDYAIMEVWLSFHDIITVQNCEARVSVDFHCKHMTYMAGIELSDLMKGECPTPSSAKATINIDHNSNITKILMETALKPAQCPAEGPRPSREPIAALLTW